MNEARPRRFPPVSGPSGWAGAALMVAGLAGEGVAVVALVWAAFNNDLVQAVPWIILLLVSLPLVAAGAWLLWLGWKRTGRLPPSSMPNEQRTASLRASAVIILGSVAGFGAFLYLAFALQGSHRLAFALAALFLGTAISDIGSMVLREILHARLPRRFGRSQKSAWVFFGVSLVASGLFFLIGLFWPNLITL